MKTKLLWDLFTSFARIGGFTFGGGYAMLPMIQREIVERRCWATEDEVLDCYAIAQCTPGVIAVNTATYIGYKQAGVLGGIFATIGVITPSFIIILLLASLLNRFVYLAPVQYALAGVRAGVCALVLKTVVALIKRNVTDVLSIIIFSATLFSALFLNISPAIPVVLAALVGIAVKSKGGAVS